MKKSKTKSPYNKIIILLFIISIFYTFIKTNTPPLTKYNLNEKEITGIITNCQKKDDLNKITIKGKEKLILNYYKDYTCTLGTKIKAQGTLTKPNKNTLSNLFNYRNYLYSQKIHYQMKVTNIINIKQNKNIFYKLKNNLIKYINTFKSKDYLNAFILGNNKDIDEEITQSYQTNGISHLLAISGMHITIISAIILFILNHISKRKKINYFLVILILIFYVFLTDFAPSVVRATALFTALTIKNILNLKIETIYILLLICTFYLYYNPYIIYNIGFLFSFIITFFLILFKNQINNKKSYLSKTFTTSLIAFTSSIPILINNFFEINLLSPFINIIFVPLVSTIIYPLSLLTLPLKSLDNLLLNIINTMENLSLIISTITMVKISLKHISLPIFLLYYLLIYHIIKNKKYLILLLIILIHHNINYLNNNSFITFIDVGQGDSTLITQAHNKSNILIDTGGLVNFNGKTYSLVDNKTIPYLKSQGINKLDYLILTHGDYDHMGESINLVNNFRVEKVIFNCGRFNELEKDLIKVLDKKKIPYDSCIKKLNIDNNKLYFLQTKEYNNENDDSNVIYTEINGYKFMFMGDAGIEKEKDILDKYKISNVDVLKVGHHGSKTSSSEEFINEINPKYGVISVGKNNRYGHPNQDVLKILDKSKIYRTDQDGSIMLKIKNNKLKIETCSP